LPATTRSRWKDVRWVFEYHGAEHKVINAFEAGESLEVPNVRNYTTVHVRCGTSFLLVVILLSILVFSAISWQSIVQRVAYKLLLLPVVAGIAYEIIKFAGGRKESGLTKFILGPGLLMQKITTQQPSDEQIEVAIKSFQSVGEAEEGVERVGRVEGGTPQGSERAPSPHPSSGDGLSNQPRTQKRAES